jgi:hypothetical protein
VNTTPTPLLPDIRGKIPTTQAEIDAFTPVGAKFVPTPRSERNPIDNSHYPDYIKNENPFFKTIWNRCNRYKKSWFQVNLGDVGSGKSWGAITQAESLDPTFTSDRIVFNAQDFLSALDTIETKGACLVYDELGVGHNARRFYSETNIMINEVLQTMRYQQCCVIFSVPDFNFIDKVSRRLAHAVMTFTRTGSNSPKAYVRFLRQDRYSGDEYRLRPLVPSEEGYGYDKLNTLNFIRRPSEKLLKAYDKKAFEYKTELRKKNLKRLSKNDDVGENVESALESILKRPELFTNKRGSFDWMLVKNEFKLGRDSAQTVAKLGNVELKINDNFKRSNKKKKRAR